MNTRLWVIVLSCLIFTPCFAKNWQGQNIQSVQSQYGQPTAVVDNGNGNQLYIYYQQSVAPDYGYGYPGGVTATTYKGKVVGTTIPPNYPKPVTNPCERRFWVDQNGTILKSQSFGYCP